MEDLLPYLHPVAMVPLILLGVAVLREGLQLRTARILRRRRSSGRHRQLAKIFVPLLVAGYASGVLSMYFTRDEPLLDSVHWWFGTGVLLAGLGAAFFGLALERGRALERRSAHALLGASSILLAVGSSLAGMSLLP
jgi:hypothetical protein